MNLRTLALRGVRYHWRAQLGVVLGVILASAVLTGALLVDDSVKYSLRRFAKLRLGKTFAALYARGRFFDASLADRVGEKAKVTAAPVLQMQGITAIFSWDLMIPTTSS